MRHLEAVLEQLRRFPESGPVIHRSYRRLLVPGFPYALFYMVERRGISISGVTDVGQDPKSIIRRLS